MKKLRLSNSVSQQKPKSGFYIKDFKGKHKLSNSNKKNSTTNHTHTKQLQLQLKTNRVYVWFRQCVD